LCLGEVVFKICNNGYSPQIMFFSNLKQVLVLVVTVYDMVVV